MIELYLSKVTESSESEQAGKYYARVSYKQTMGVQEMAHHMSEHNTMFSEGSICGILIDFVKCVREMVLMGNTVKIDNLAIFKASVEANGLETLYDAAQDKVAQATVGTLAEGAKTGPAVKVIKLLAQSTGDFTREELKKDAKLAWTDKTKAEIAAAKGEAGSTGSTSNGSNSGSTGNGGSTSQGGNSGNLTPGGNGGNTGGGDNTGGGGDDNGGSGSGDDV
jgi:predicted histone-like DNA-binding protein